MSLLSFLLVACSDYDLNRPDDVKPGPEDSEPPIEETAPDIEVEPLTIDFGTILKECQTSPQTVTIRNKGNADLDVTEIDLSGDGVSNFGLSAAPMVLAPGEEGTFTVDFAPTAETDFAVQVVVRSNDPDEAKVRVDLTGAGGEESIFEETFDQEAYTTVDVLWIVDNSGSMSDKIGAMNDNFKHFIGPFLDLGLDFHMAVVTTDMDNPAQKGKMQGPVTYIDTSTANPEATFEAMSDQGANGSGDERGLDASYTALTEPLVSGYNAGFLREEAALAVVVLSDENDYSTITDPTKYKKWLLGLKADPSLVTFSAIVGDKGFIGCSDFSTGYTAEGGDRYIEVVDATGGAFESICTADFEGVMGHLGTTAVGIKDSFVLSKTPSSPGKAKVYVDGTLIPYSGISGWSWDAARNAVKFSKDQIPERGSEVLVMYPVAGECP